MDRKEPIPIEQEMPESLDPPFMTEKEKRIQEWAHKEAEKMILNSKGSTILCTNSWVAESLVREFNYHCQRVIKKNDSNPQTWVLEKIGN